MGFLCYNDSLMKEPEPKLKPPGLCRRFSDDFSGHWVEPGLALAGY